MWDSVLMVFTDTLDKAVATYLAKAKSVFLPIPQIEVHAHPQYSPGFNCTDEENTASLITLRRRAWLALRAKVDEQTSDTNILSKLRATFEERFRYDENGVPRVWKPEDDIDVAFRKARDQVRNYISVYICRLWFLHYRLSSLFHCTQEFNRPTLP